ncbi:hypothetical protein SKAU_G00244950, partial [Synaphobranchus kaupii]
MNTWLRRMCSSTWRMQLTNSWTTRRSMSSLGSFDTLLSSGFNWPHAAVLLLIETWRSLKDTFESPVIKRRRAWEMVAQILRLEGYSSVTWQSCDTKWRNLRHRYKTIVDGHNKTGQGRQKWEYFALLDEVFAGDPAVTPIVVLSSLQPQASPLSQLQSGRARGPQPQASPLSQLQSGRARSPQPQASPLSQLQSGRARGPQPQASPLSQLQSGRARSPQPQASPLSQLQSGRARSPQPQASPLRQLQSEPTIDPATSVVETLRGRAQKRSRPQDADKTHEKLDEIIKLQKENIEIQKE